MRPDSKLDLIRCSINFDRIAEVVSLFAAAYRPKIKYRSAQIHFLTFELGVLQSKSIGMNPHIEDWTKFFSGIHQASDILSTKPDGLRITSEQDLLEEDLSYLSRSLVSVISRQELIGWSQAGLCDRSFVWKAIAKWTMETHRKTSN